MDISEFYNQTNASKIITEQSFIYLVAQPHTQIEQDTFH